MSLKYSTERINYTWETIWRKPQVKSILSHHETGKLPNYCLYLPQGAEGILRIIILIVINRNCYLAVVGFNYEYQTAASNWKMYGAYNQTSHLWSPPCKALAFFTYKFHGSQVSAILYRHLSSTGHITGRKLGGKYEKWQKRGR